MNITYRCPEKNKGRTPLVLVTLLLLLPPGFPFHTLALEELKLYGDEESGVFNQPIPI
jgi:hypothetical protein